MQVLARKPAGKKAAGKEALHAALKQRALRAVAQRIRLWSA
jgi:hypothetical protein